MGVFQIISFCILAACAFSMIGGITWLLLPPKYQPRDGNEVMKPIIQESENVKPIIQESENVKPITQESENVKPIVKEDEEIKPTREGRAKHEPPHIVFILADDLGWNDVSYHGSPEIPTPNIDALALSGIALNRYYVSSLCSPSRGSFLTGKYANRLGLQHSVLKAGEQTCLPLDEVTIAQHLKKLNYSTHLVGKWHMGYAKMECTPTYRGFDTFFGYYNGLIDYYQYTMKQTISDPLPTEFYGIDLQNGTDPVTNFRGVIATDKFTEEAQEVIKNHDTTKPMFLYLSHLAVHVSDIFANSVEQAKPEDMDKFSYIGNRSRRVHAARVWGLDRSLGDVFESLDKKDMLNNSIVIFSADNGGQTNGLRNGYATNYPLKGGKNTMWEGGIRVPAIVWSPLLHNREHRISRQLTHVSDWLPTLYAAAGGDMSELDRLDLDGVNQWDALSKDQLSSRTDILHNVDPTFGFSAYLEGDMKVINGSIELNNWYGPSGLEYVSEPESMEEWVFREGSKVRDISTKMGMWTVKDVDQWYSELKVQCVQPPPKRADRCDPSRRPCLFNVNDDPCEYYNLANRHPRVVKKIMKKIAKHASLSSPPLYKPIDLKADPVCYNFTYVPFVGTDRHEACNVW